MQTTWQQTHWLNNNPIQRQLIAFAISVFIVVLVLLIPITLNFDFMQQDGVIQVTLSKDIEAKKIAAITQQKEIKLEVVEKPTSGPTVKNIQESIKPKQKTVNTTPIQVAPKVIEQLATTPIDEQPEKLPSSAVIFESAYGKVKLYEMDDDFKARTGHEGDFKFPEINQPEWNQVTKLIDEEVDKPRVEMNFYSEGIVGVTEKFFDKISYKKVFTTRYGTKIACGGVGPLVMCSWK